MGTIKHLETRMRNQVVNAEMFEHVCTDQLAWILKQTENAYINRQSVIVALN